MQPLRTRRWSHLILTLLMIAGVALPARAGVRVYEQGDKYIEIGGRVQIQYHLFDPDGGDSEDDLFFRRLRPYIEGSVTANWEGKIQFDLGKSRGGNEVAIKDAYILFTGLENIDLYIGNTKTVFSREFLTSSKRQQLVERTFVGDHNFGSPDRNLGLRIDGHNASEKIQWKVSLGSEAIDPDAKKLDFDTPVNRDDDFNEGWVAAARLELHPLGKMAPDQGDLDRGERAWAFGLGVFTWSNDDDNNTRTAGAVATDARKPDVDGVTGFELSGGFRGGGWSFDAEYQMLDAETVDSTFTGGLYRRGETTLDLFAIEGGYLLPGSPFELVVGIENLDADNYQDVWKRTSFGLNYFLNGHKTKVQLTYRMGENLDGVTGNDADEAFVQFQFVF